MKALILIVCLLIMGTQAFTAGSCSKYSLGGEKCEKCIDHYHLYEGVCYVDILGCSDYIFGNICHTCENGYILVNNLCCDHNCLMKLLKRHESKSLSNTISNNFEILSKIIPFVEQHYIKESVSNLVDIQQRKYIDVIRYVILYEFPSGRFRMRRAVIDYVIDTKQIVAVDWSIVQNVSQFLDFHKDQISLDDKNKVNSILEAAFGSSPPTATQLRKAKLSEIDQYEIIYSDMSKQKIIFQTFYVRNQRRLLLLSEEKPVPQFMPSEDIVKYSEFESYQKVHSEFGKVVAQVQADPRFKPTFDHAVVKYKTRNVIEYNFWIINEIEQIIFFVIQNTKQGSVKIIDYSRKTFEPLKPLVSNVVSQLSDTTQETKLSAEQNKVAQLVQNAIKTVKKQKQEQYPLGDEEECDDRTKSNIPLEEEQLEIVKIFRKKNPTLTSFIIVQTWVHRFRTFTEWSLLIKVENGKTYTFYFFHVIQYHETKRFSFWGQTETQEPKLNKDGKYILHNPQENVPESQVSQARAAINKKFPQVSGFPLRKSVLRTFPDTHLRFVIILRQETTEVRYVVLEQSSQNIWVQQWETISQDLPKLTAAVESMTEIQQKLQVIVDQVQHGKQINPEVSLNTVDPIVIKEQPKKQQPKKEQHIVKVHKQEEVVKNVIQEIRDNNEHLVNFQIIQTWSTETPLGQRETVLIKPIVKEEQKETIETKEIIETKETKETKQTKQTKEEPKYQYHTIIVNNKTKQTKYLGLDTRVGLVRDENEKLAEPKQNIDLTKTPKTPHEQMKAEIIDTVERVKDYEEVTDIISTGIEQFVYEQELEVHDWKVVRTWTNKNFKTYRENVILYQKETQFKYVYIFEWLHDGQKSTYTQQGVTSVQAPLMTVDKEYRNPNPQERFEVKDAQDLISFIVQENPEVSNNEINKIIVRVFPLVTRYRVTLRSGTSKYMFVIHVRGSTMKIVEWKVVETNLPVFNHNDKVVKELIKQSLNVVKETKKEQYALSENCDEKEKSNLAIDEKQVTIIKLFRQRNPKVVSFNVVQTWVREFRTFKEWTLLIKFTIGDTSSYYYFHALEFTDGKQWRFFGQVEESSPKVDAKGKYVLVNPQENVPETKVTKARAAINKKFPQVDSLPLRSSILRVFPDSHNRFVIVLRHKTSQVRYVVLEDSSKDEQQVWVQEWETIEFGLEELTSAVTTQTQIQHSLQVIATAVEQSKPIQKQVDLTKISETKVQISTPIKVVEPSTVNLQFQVIQTSQTIESGKKTQTIRTMSTKTQTIMTRIIKYIKTKTITKLTTRYIEIIEKNIPVTVIDTDFCDHSDFLVIFDVDSTIYVFAFRALISDTQQIEFLGSYEFVKQENMSDEQIIAKATQIRSLFQQQKAMTAIKNLHNQAITAQSIKSVTLSQMGDYIRASIILRVGNNINRYIVSNGASVQQSYSVIQQCRLQQLQVKPIITQTKVTITGQTQLITNDVSTLVQNDKTTQSIIQDIQRQVPQAVDVQPTQIKVTNYDKKTQYVVTFVLNTTQVIKQTTAIQQTTTSTVQQQKQGQVKQVKQVIVEKPIVHQVVIIHDKVTHSNDIISSKPIDVPVLTPLPTIPVQPITIKQQTTQSTTTQTTTQSTTQTTKQQPSQVVQQIKLQQPLTPTPIVSSQSYTVVTGITAQVPQQTHTIINKITQQVKQQQNIINTPIQIKQTLIKDDGNIQKIQQVINVIQTEQQILVTAVVNKDNGKYIIQDVKPVDQHIVKHLVESVVKPIVVVQQTTSNVVQTKQQQTKQQQTTTQQTTTTTTIKQQSKPVQQSKPQQIIVKQVQPMKATVQPIVQIKPSDIQNILIQVQTEIKKKQQQQQQTCNDANSQSDSNTNSNSNCKRVKQYIAVKQAQQNKQKQTTTTTSQQVVKQQTTTTQSTTTTSTQQIKQIKQVIVINPSDIQTVVTQLKQQITVVPVVQQPKQVYNPPVVFNQDQALAYLQTVKPQTANTKVIQAVFTNLPNSVTAQLVLQDSQNRQHVVLTKKDNTIDVVSFDQSPLIQPTTNIVDSVSNTETTTSSNTQTTSTTKSQTLQTIHTIVKQFESIDKAGYIPVDTNSVNMIKATQIINQPSTTTQSQTTQSTTTQQSTTTTSNTVVQQQVVQPTKVDLSNPKPIDNKVVQQIRQQYPIIKDAAVIQMTTTQVSQNIQQKTINFYTTNQNNNNQYVVHQIITQVDTSKPQPIITPISVTQVVNNGQHTNVVLQKRDPTQFTFANAAYGYIKVNLNDAKNDQDIQTIQRHIQNTYVDYVKTDTLQSIEILELKNGKANYIFRYNNVYFTIYWDSLLKKILFLNQVNSLTQTKFTQVTQNKLYTTGMQAIVALHTTQMQNMKVISSGQYDQTDTFAFIVQFVSSGKKYRSIFNIDKLTLQTTQIMFTQLLQVPLIRPQQLAMMSNFQVLGSKQFGNNKYFGLVNQYNINQNQLLKGAKILGAGYKPQNLGFSYKIFYLTVDNKIVSVETYVETFSSKYTQTSFSILDFVSSFSPVNSSGAEIDSLVNSIADKASLKLAKGSYTIESFQGKDFFFGTVFKIVMTIDSIQYEGLVYLDEASNVYLLVWNAKPQGNGCKTRSVDMNTCVECASGFVASADNTTCLPAIAGCDTYGLDKTTCSVCQVGFTNLLGICTSDCGPLCSGVVFP